MVNDVGKSQLLAAQVISRHIHLFSSANLLMSIKTLFTTSWHLPGLL